MPQMEWMQVKGNTWYLAGMELIPVYRLDDRHCILLDSGWKLEREQLRQALERHHMTPLGVLGTHSHVDHAGNQRWLKKTYGTRICMPEGEARVADPVKRQGHREEKSFDPASIFTDGLTFQTDETIGSEDGIYHFLGVPFRIHHTPGHSPDHICIGTPDGVCYVGDLLMAGNHLKKARLPYHHTQALAKASIGKMLAVEEYEAYLVAHKGVLDRLAPTAEENLALMNRTTEEILEILDKPVTWDELVLRTLERNQLKSRNEEEFIAFQGLIQSFAEDLQARGKMMDRVEHGVRRFWRT